MTPANSHAAFEENVQRTLAGQGRKPVQRNTPNGRLYDIDGELYPSVTNVLGVINKPALVHWAANLERTLCVDAAADLYLDVAKTPPMSRAAYVATLTTRLGVTKAHRRELEKATEIGSQAHKMIEHQLRRSLGQKVGPEPLMTEGAQVAFMAFGEWAASVDLKPLFIEQIVYSKTHRYAGTMDLGAIVEGVPTLVDFKTGKAVYSQAHLQTAAYRHALKEMGHADLQRGLIVRLPKNASDPVFEVAESPSVEALMPVFLAVRELWTWHDMQERAYRARRDSQKGVA